MEIKFRAKNKNYNTWSFGSYVDGIVPVIVTNDNDKIIVEECFKETVGQFTGLSIKDYSVMPIYEGDIVVAKHTWIPQKSNLSILKFDSFNELLEGNDEYLLEKFESQNIKYAYDKTVDKRWQFYQHYYFRNYVVERDMSDGGWRIRNKDVFHKLTNSIIYNKEIRIIGNIHDNPELLTTYKNYDNKVVVKEKILF